MINEITRKEFEERFPEVSTYGLEQLMTVYLNNGVILTEYEWNGEVYTVKDNGRERTFKPIQEPISFDDDGEPEQWETIGFEEI